MRSRQCGLLSLSLVISLASAQNADHPYRIDLPTALQLAKAQNLDVQIARARLDEAKANHSAAIAKFLPWISAGVSFRRHEGRTQAIDGTLVDVDKQSTAYGPTINAQVDIGDALYSTLAAKQTINATTAGLSAQEQDSSLAAASGYFDLLKAQALVDVNQEALKTSETYQQQISNAVGAGVAFKGDELRVQTQTERFRSNLVQVQQQQRSAAARLAQQLHLDPSVELVPQSNELVPLSMIDANATLDSLLTKAIKASPELKQGQALAAAARESKNSTTYGPLIPSIGVQAFLGEFGGGRDNASGNYAGSKDYFFGVSWRLGPGGLFDFTRIKASNARLHVSELNVDKTIDTIKRQVVDSYSRVKSLSQQISSSRNSLTAAAETLRLTRERKQLGVGVVLEDLQAQQELVRARADYLSVIVDYNKAQYELSKALGAL